MPRDFEVCVKKGGKVKRIAGPNDQFGLKKGEYMNVCFINNEMFRGEKHKAETEKKK
ncbi:MAG: hypothetical protein M0R74_16975 [Dehalococcoidia bacterium]|nr:hypothetical protein [Dehalococcoidia bacterium]